MTIWLTAYSIVNIRADRLRIIATLRPSFCYYFYFIFFFIADWLGRKMFRDGRATMRRRAHTRDKYTQGQRIKSVWFFIISSTHIHHETHVHKEHKEKCRYCSHALDLSSRVLRSRSVLRCYFIPCNIRNSLTKNTYILHLRNLEHRMCKTYNYININI